MSENKHTPEPWSAGVIKYKGEWHFTAVPVGNEGKITALCGLAGANGEDESIANARRITACVNACAGIPTYQLTAENDNPTNLGEVIDAIREQRDELLAALEKFIDSHEECTDFDGFTAQIVSMDDYHEAQKSFDRVKYHGQPEKQPENESGEVGK